ncbi:CoA transferase [Gemmobacter sp.]|uniref:CoA transferase n=1 Tax=Gemmobacter sp. TaxID=1898957 RepID=UPI002AFE41EB|nr:CoA transferase [Gemmobacter sp.]
MSRLARAEARLAARVSHWSAAMGAKVDPVPGLCTLRSGLLGLPAPGRVSANGSCRLIRAADGWLAVSLPRPADRDLVPALLGHPCDTADPWPALARALPCLPAADVLAQAALLGLAVTRLAEAGPRRAAAQGTPRSWHRAPVVVDLSSLWAGPLCGALLAQAGCDVLKIDSLQRPDTTAVRSAPFDAVLNGAKRHWRMDAASPEDQAQLRGLLAGADIVLTSARPRALDWLAACLPATCLWVAIRAHADPARIGFGDDCAVAGGLVDWADGPVFAGDAAADPLTGLAAAAAAFRGLALGQGGRIDLALSTVAAGAAHA